MPWFIAAKLMLGGWLKTAVDFLKGLPWWVYAIIAAAILLFVVYHKGETKGAAKVTAKVEKAHQAAVVAAAVDTKAAQAATEQIGADVKRTNAAVTDLVQTKIQEMHNALDAIPPAAAGAALPPAPVERMQQSLNALGDGANRAADAADAEP
jgi:type III secretory pathway component EscV